MGAGKIKVREEDKSKALKYLKKAEDNHSQMLKSFREGNYNASSTLAIQCVISAADAVCIHEKGIRSISQNHLDLCELIKSIPLPESRSKSNSLKKIISKKNLIQYESRSIYGREADEIVKNASRFFRWAATVLK